jgi:hypothetical protein
MATLNTPKVDVDAASVSLPVRPDKTGVFSTRAPAGEVSVGLGLLLFQAKTALRVADLSL